MSVKSSESEIPNDEWFKKNQHRIPGHENDPIYEDESWIDEAAKIIKDDDNQGGIEGSIKSDQESTNSPIFSLDKLFNRQFPDIGWIVDQLIPSQGLVALSGTPGSYKSWITEHLAICVARGTSLFGQFQVIQGPVLIIDKENNLRLIKERFKALGAIDGLKIHFFNLESFDFLTEDKETIDLVTSIIRDNNIKLVIIDSLIRAHKQDENSASGMSLVFEALRKIQDAGAAIVFTHHHRKQTFFNRSNSSDSLRGSSDILAAVDCHLAVDRLEDGIKITQTKLRQKQAIKPFKIRLEKISELSDQVGFIYLGDINEEKEKLEAAKEAISEILNDEQEHSRQDILDQLTGIFGRTTIDLALKSFTKEEVTTRTGEHNKKFYQKTQTNQLPLEEED